jgi:hypothetical protein
MRDMAHPLLILLFMNAGVLLGYYQMDYKYVDFAVNRCGMQREIAAASRPLFYLTLLVLGVPAFIGDIYSMFFRKEKSYILYKPE